jgi:hypothetical protein
LPRKNLRCSLFLPMFAKLPAKWVTYILVFSEQCRIQFGLIAACVGWIVE